MPPFGDDPNAGVVLPAPNMGAAAGFPAKLKGLAGDAALEAPKANAPVEVVGDAVLDPPKAKGEDPAAPPPNEKVVGEELDPVLVAAPKPPKTEGDCED